MIDADAWADAGAGRRHPGAGRSPPAPPPVLLVGAHLPTGVVRNLLRLERSDVLDAPFTAENIAAAIDGADGRSRGRRRRAGRRPATSPAAGR